MAVSMPRVLASIQTRDRRDRQEPAPAMAAIPE
jgi:hypothetical protein